MRGALGVRRKGIRLPKRVVAVGALLACLVVLAAACGDRSAATYRTLAIVNGLTLTEGHPGVVAVDVTTEQTLRISILVEHPLASYELGKTADVDGSTIALEPVDLEVRADEQSSGSSTYELSTARPLTPGGYRIKLLGNGRVEYMEVGLLPEPE